MICVYCNRRYEQYVQFVQYVLHGIHAVCTVCIYNVMRIPWFCNRFASAVLIDACGWAHCFVYKRASMCIYTIYIYILQGNIYTSTPVCVLVYSNSIQYTVYIGISACAVQCKYGKVSIRSICILFCNYKFRHILQHITIQYIT